MYNDDEPPSYRPSLIASSTQQKMSYKRNRSQFFIYNYKKKNICLA